MNGRRYWRERIPVLLLNAAGIVLLGAFLLLTGNSVDMILLIVVVWTLALAGVLLLSYYRKKKRLGRLKRLSEGLKERYLLAELLPEPQDAEEEVWFFLLKQAFKSMLEQTNDVLREREEYREYIEQWIHEIKTPITAMKLLCENHTAPFTRELMTELEKTDRFTEQALYYARSEHTEKDYSIRELRLFDVVHQAIADNKYLLLQNGVSLVIDENDVTVYSDDKWIRFILDQLIVNAVKYKGSKPELHFYAQPEGDKIYLFVEDSGIGIPAGDLPRIFEKGFTGQNGRSRQNSTGIGLYLCKRLCDKLGIGICAESAGEGTRIRLAFQINHFIHQVQG